MIMMTTTMTSNGGHRSSPGSTRASAAMGVLVVGALVLIALAGAGSTSTTVVDAVPTIFRPSRITSAATTTPASSGDPSLRHHLAFIINEIRGGVDHAVHDDYDGGSGSSSTPVYDEDDGEEYDLEDDDGEEGDEEEDDDDEEEEEKAETIMDEENEDDAEDEEVDDWEDLEELEEDMIAVEVAALQDQVERDGMDVLKDETVEEDENDDVAVQDVVDDVLDELENVSMEDENIVMVGASTTDGELADDEETDDSSVASAEELVAITAGGGLAMFADDEEMDVDDAAVTTNATSVVTNVENGIISEISNEMKQILRNELSYTEREVKLMRPDIAAIVVYNRLSRPGEGMPSNFYIEGHGPPGPLREHGAKIVVTAIAVGTIAITAAGLKEGDIDLSDFADVLKSIPKALLAAGMAVRGKVRATLPSEKTKAVAEPNTVASMPGEMTDVQIVEEATRENPEDDSSNSSNEAVNEDHSIHSIKPGTKTGPKMNEDETALDKFLTKIENMIKGFFRIRI